MHFIKKYWLLALAVIFAFLSIYAATGMSVGTGIKSGTGEITVSQPFAGGLFSASVSLNDWLENESQINQAISQLIAIFWIFAILAAISLVAFVFFYFHARRKQRSGPIDIASASESA